MTRFADHAMSAMGAERGLAVLQYLDSRPGELTTADEVAAALGVPPATAEAELRALRTCLGGFALTRLQGGWMYWAT